MSDDSYMYVFPMKDGKFGVENRSASCKYEGDPKKPEGGSAKTCSSIQEAMTYANEKAFDCEYGVSVSPNLKIRCTYEVVETEEVSQPNPDNRLTPKSWGLD